MSGSAEVSEGVAGVQTRVQEKPVCTAVALLLTCASIADRHAATTRGLQAQRLTRGVQDAAVKGDVLNPRAVVIINAIGPDDGDADAT